jgi:hypothetical protein
MNSTQSALAVGVEHEPILTDLTLRSLLHFVQDPTRTTPLQARNFGRLNSVRNVKDATRAHPSWLLSISIFFSPVPAQTDTCARLY